MPFFFVEMFCILLKCFVVDSPDSLSNSPLHWATKKDNQPILLALIKGGANVNARGHIGKTPLHIAVSLHIYLFFEVETCGFIIEVKV